MTKSERLITLGGAPYSTFLREFADNTRLSRCQRKLQRTAWKTALSFISRVPLLNRPLPKGIDVTGEEGDDNTRYLHRQKAH